MSHLAVSWRTLEWRQQLQLSLSLYWPKVYRTKSPKKGRTRGRTRRLIRCPIPLPSNVSKVEICVSCLASDVFAIEFSDSSKMKQKSRLPGAARRRQRHRSILFKTKRHTHTHLYQVNSCELFTRSKLRHIFFFF